jgi:hypothetical protein
MAGPHTAADIPRPYDVVIDGWGFLFADTVQSNPFGVQRASYGRTPTFLPRSNVQGDYGDNQQDFFMILTQRDWSLGAGQKYFRSGDEESQRRFYDGIALDISVPGEVSLREALLSKTAAGAVVAMCDDADVIWFATSTNLYSLPTNETIADHGAHGLGVAPFPFGMVSDEQDVYLSSVAGGTVGVRKWTGAAFSTFSASASDTLAYLNNSLYGFSGGVLYRYDTAGARSTIFTWKGADGGTHVTDGRMRQYGGDLAVLLLKGPSGRGELHLYDGTAPSMVAQFPINFVPSDLETMYGIAFIAGRFTRHRTSVEYKPAIFYYAAGSIGLLWAADTWTTTDKPVAVNTFATLLVFNDDSTGTIRSYNLETGGVHAIASFTVAGSSPLISCSRDHFLHSRNQTTMYMWPDTGIATTGYVTSSLFDADSSLTKRFQSVKLDVDIPAGATVDIAYRLNDLDGAFTTIQAGALPGVEYTIGNQARSVSIRVTLNKGSASTSPKLHRVYVRATPILNVYRQSRFLLNLTGRDGVGQLKRRDGVTFDSRDGHSMAVSLNAICDSQVPVTIIDRFGSFTGIIVADGYEIVEVRPENYIAVVTVRAV